MATHLFLCYVRKKEHSIYKTLPFVRRLSACLLHEADVLFFSSITAPRTALGILLVSVNIAEK